MTLQKPVPFTPHSWQDDLAANGLVQKLPTLCQGCGRPVPAFALIETTNIPDKVIALEWSCTACVNEAVRSAKITKSNLIKKLKKTKEARS